jgi:hypothetical protein
LKLEGKKTLMACGSDPPNEKCQNYLDLYNPTTRPTTNAADITVTMVTISHTPVKQLPESKCQIRATPTTLLKRVPIMGWNKNCLQVRFLVV